MSLNALSSNNYTGGSPVDAVIPQALVPDKIARPALPNLKMRCISSSSTNGNSVNAGNSAFFSLAPQGMIKGQSMYLKCTITPNVACTFKGGVGAQSLINRVTISSGGVAEVLPNYDKWAQILYRNNTNLNYLIADASVMEGASTTNPPSGGDLTNIPTTGLEVCLPILSNIFGSQRAFGLFMLNQPLQVELAFNAIKDAVYLAAGGITSLVISNLSLIYECIYPGQEYENMCRQKALERGGLNFQFMSYLNHQFSTATGASASFTGGVGKSSVCAVIHACVPTSEVNDQKAPTQITKNGQSAQRLYLDGNLALNYDITSSSQNLIEYQKSTNSCFDVNTTIACTSATYNATSYATGFNTRAFNENIISGVPVNQLQYQSTGATADCTNYLYVLYNANCVISADGVLSVQA
jgi:hypothetical protein